MKVIAFSLLSTVILWMGTQYCATASDATGLSQLSKLETRLLGHTYSKDQEEKRVSRLEKLVFGESNHGDWEERLASLQAALPKDKDAEYSSSAAPLDSLSQPENSNPSSNEENSDSYSTGAKDSEDPEDSEEEENNLSQTNQTSQPSYPRITALEEAILGKTYSYESLPDRLKRMEEKLFGKTSDQAALSDRTDKLQAYIEKETKHKLFAEESEQQNIANGSPGTDDSNAQTQKRSRLPQIVNAVSNVLFGPTNMPYGPAMGPVGFGGVRIRDRQDVEQEKLKREEAEISEEKRRMQNIDPAISQLLPPPPGSKMLTRVGWCEQRLFGETFVTMHLPKRLEQINQELKYKPGRSGIMLMDDIDNLIKLVAAKQGIKSSNKTIGSKALTKPMTTN